MTDTAKSSELDVTRVVVRSIQSYLGTEDDIALNELLEDLGLDSIGITVTLLDVCEQLGIDLGATQLDLSASETIRDVAVLIAALADGGGVSVNDAPA
jgi:acyl carrier protein